MCSTQSKTTNLRHPKCLWKCWPSLTEWLASWRLDVLNRAGVVVAPPCGSLCPEGGGVEWAPLEDFVSQKAAGLPVLVTQQGVDKRVARCLAVGQTFGQHTPVRAYGPCGKELYNSTSNEAKMGRKVTHNPQAKCSIWAMSYRSV